jgi:hypothetical protein
MPKYLVEISYLIEVEAEDEMEAEMLGREEFDLINPSTGDMSAEVSEK